MALKSYNELVKLDVAKHCEYRDAKDEQGRKIRVPYLNWAKCIELLHQNGAETVYYTPLRASDGSYLFSSAAVSNKDGRKTGCWFVSVEIHIDDLTFTMDMPLLNGSIMVYEDTLNQLRISNCHARAFVKGVAIRTGLGFSLWSGEKDTDGGEDDLSGHNIMAIKTRMERLITAKLQNGISMDDMLSCIGLNQRKFDNIMAQFGNIALLEQKIRTL